jgi:Tfp pilus assembly protein PilF
MLLFDDDLEKRNRIDANLLVALAEHSQGNEAQALAQLERILHEDPNQLFAASVLRWIKQSIKARIGAHQPEREVEIPS